MDEVAETSAKVGYFGRISSGKSQSPFPQVRCLDVAEVGTHAIIDAVAGPLSCERTAVSSRGGEPLSASGHVGAAGSRRGLGGLDLARWFISSMLTRFPRLKADQFKRVERVLSDGS